MHVLSLLSLTASALLFPAAQAGAQPAADTRVRIAFTGTETPLPNPERGFYRASPNHLHQLDAGFLTGVYRDGYRLVYARIDLEDFRGAPLPETYLTKLQAGFAAARQAGVKLIVRATYNYPRGETQYRDAQDAPLEVVLGHLDQLRPVLEDNADVIAFLQAGFVGAWGEWHTSSNDLTSPENRTAIKDALLAATPDNRFVQFRYPPYIRDWVPVVPAAPALLRIGFHNDCFLASQTDVGTFDEDPAVRAGQQDHVARLGDVAPFGGETCNPADDPGATPRTTCEDIRVEGVRYNLTYLNSGYFRPLFHDAWARGGCADEVAAKMGYRLRLVDAAYDGRTGPGNRLRLAVTVRNEGWARLYNPRSVQVVLRARSGGETVRLAVPAVDPRMWLPGTTTPVSLDVTLPAGLRRGAYELMIAFPDASPRLAADPRYAVRPANADVEGQRWDAALGAFNLGVDVKVG